MSRVSFVCVFSVPFRRSTKVVSVTPGDSLRRSVALVDATSSSASSSKAPTLSSTSSSLSSSAHHRQRRCLHPRHWAVVSHLSRGEEGVFPGKQFSVTGLGSGGVLAADASRGSSPTWHVSGTAGSGEAICLLAWACKGRHRLAGVDDRNVEGDDDVVVGGFCRGGGRRFAPPFHSYHIITFLPDRQRVPRRSTCAGCRRRRPWLPNAGHGHESRGVAKPSYRRGSLDLGINHAHHAPGRGRRIDRVSFARVAAPRTTFPATERNEEMWHHVGIATAGKGSWTVHAVIRSKATISSGAVNSVARPTPPSAPIAPNSRNKAAQFADTHSRRGLYLHLHILHDPKHSGLGFNHQLVRWRFRQRRRLALLTANARHSLRRTPELGQHRRRSRCCARAREST